MIKRKTSDDTNKARRENRPAGKMMNPKRGIMRRFAKTDTEDILLK
jgi:hypothetical protein